MRLGELAASEEAGAGLSRGSAVKKLTIISRTCFVSNYSCSLLILRDKPAEIAASPPWKAPPRPLRPKNGERILPVICFVRSTGNHTRCQREPAVGLERVRTACASICCVFRGALPLSHNAQLKFVFQYGSCCRRCNTPFRSRTRKRSNRMA